MSWEPLGKMSEINAAEAAGLPIPVTVYDDAGTANVVEMRVGGRYRFATERINVVGTVVEINYGARYPLHMMYLSAFGDSLLGHFSPDDLLRVYPL